MFNSDISCSSNNYFHKTDQSLYQGRPVFEEVEQEKENINSSNPIVGACHVGSFFPLHQMQGGVSVVPSTWGKNLPVKGLVRAFKIHSMQKVFIGVLNGLSEKNPQSRSELVAQYFAEGICEAIAHQPHSKLREIINKGYQRACLKASNHQNLFYDSWPSMPIKRGSTSTLSLASISNSENQSGEHQGKYEAKIFVLGNSGVAVLHKKTGKMGFICEEEGLEQSGQICLREANSIHHESSMASFDETCKQMHKDLKLVRKYCTINLEHGDFLIMASKGLWNNIKREDIQKIIKELEFTFPIEHENHAIPYAYIIAEIAKFISKQTYPLLNFGGKLDDISIVVSKAGVQWDIEVNEESVKKYNDFIFTQCGMLFMKYADRLENEKNFKTHKAPPINERNTKRQKILLNSDKIKKERVVKPHTAAKITFREMKKNPPPNTNNHAISKPDKRLKLELKSNDHSGLIDLTQERSADLSDFVNQASSISAAAIPLLEPGLQMLTSVPVSHPELLNQASSPSDALPNAESELPTQTLSANHDSSTHPATEVIRAATQPKKKLGKRDPQIMMAHFLSKKSEEIEASLKKALSKLEPISLDFEICKVPGLGYGLRATKPIPMGTTIGGILNGEFREMQKNDSSEVSPAYQFDLKMKIGKKGVTVVLDGNTPAIREPLLNQEELKAACQARLGKQASILQLINYSPSETANVMFAEFTFKWKGRTFQLPQVVAMRDIAPGEELRVDYGDLYFHISLHYFFEKFKENIAEKTIENSELECLYDIASEHCCDQNGAILKIEESSYDKIIQQLSPESQALLNKWKGAFFKTIENLYNKKAEYSKASPEISKTHEEASPLLRNSINRKEESQKSKENHFQEILNHQKLRKFQGVYKKIKDSLEISEAFLEKIIKKLEITSLDCGIRTMVAFLFSDLETEKKNIILKRLGTKLETILQKTASPERLGYANANFCIFKDTTLLHLVAWLSDDFDFAKHIIQLFETYSPSTFKKEQFGHNTPFDYAEYYGNSIMKTLIEQAQARLAAKNE